ncbi:MAG: hypothetical protein WCT12_17745 [Verrucomicrobiota bacterium]
MSHTPQGLIFDAALIDLAHLNVGDHVNVTVREGCAIVLTPIRPSIEPEQRTTLAGLSGFRRGEIIRSSFRNARFMV